MMKSARMKRMESKKSHSWWWDSHNHPKNSKWLQENLEEMDQHVKRMLKLIEEDGDSFAKKVEIYYQKRPELIHLVEEIYRMYRSLAERYDNVTGDLKKSNPSDIQSQSSGISDVGSEPPFIVSGLGQRQSRGKSGPRAAGFDFFLGSGGSASDLYSKEGDESSTLDSESESEGSSVNNYYSTQSMDEEQGLRRKIVELETELREAKEKGQMQGDEITEDSEVSSKIETCEEELRVAKEEILHLKMELEKYVSMGDSNNGLSEDVLKEKLANMNLRDGLNGHGGEDSDKIEVHETGLGITEEKLRLSEEEVVSLREELINKSVAAQNWQQQIKSMMKDVSVWKHKFEKEKSEVTKMMDRIVRYKNSLSDRDQEIRGLRENISNANKCLSEENDRLETEITRMLKERHYLEDNLKDMDLRCQILEEDLRRVKAGKAEMEESFENQLQQLKVDISAKNEQLEESNKSLDALKLRIEVLVAEKNGLNEKVADLMEEIHSKEQLTDKLKELLNQSQMEHSSLILRVKDLESEVGKQNEMILEGAEGKREAIRQLCLSIEHYRDGYHQLRLAVSHRRPSVSVS